MTEMASPAQPRECLVTKQDGKGYGFFLRVEMEEKGHLIRTVEKGSSADTAGLKDGDRVLRVNDAFVDEKDHNEIVDLIKKSGSSVTLLVLDQASYDILKKKGEDMSKLSKTSGQPAKQPGANPSEKQDSSPPAKQDASPPAKQDAIPPAKQEVTSADSTPKPRICYMVKEGGSYGFSLKSRSGAKGVVLGALAPAGAAAKAGAREGDRIIQLNGKNVENDKQDRITSKVKESGASVVFLLVDKETDDYFLKAKLSITADKADLESLPHKPRIVDLKKDPNGYGFFLRQVKKQKGHFIVDIDAGSPAERAKLKDFDRVLAVNGESVEGFEHERVVEAIRKGGDQIKFLIVDKTTDELYTKAGVSPYLYLKVVKKNEQKDPTPAVIPSVTPSTKPAPAPTQVTPAPTTAAASPDPKNKPRLCQLQKSTDGYGFNLNAIKEVPGTFIKQVVKGGSADTAGLKEEDILVEVNGVNVEKDEYADVITKIKNVSGNLILLVVSQDGYEYYKSHKITIISSMADPLPKKEPPSNNTEKVPLSNTEKSPSSNTVTTPSSNTEKPPSSNTVTTPPSNTVTTPPSNTEKPPSSNTVTTPSSNTEKPPSSNTVTTPSSNTEKPPSSNTVTTPPSNTVTTPPSNTEKPPSSNTVTTPSSNTEKPPSSNTVTTPSSNTEKPQSSNTVTTPPSNTEKPPSSNTVTTPSSNTVTTPLSNTEKPPSSNTVTTPSSNTEKPPSSNAETTPSSNNEKSPSSNVEKTPSSNTENPPSSKAKSAPESTEMVASSPSEKKSEPQPVKDDNIRM
uniref:PDZ domain containing 1 n=1 Tax=Leptobrachium leishanense TaxID=445787 RepID=A0A8C5LML9_9ANUR